MTTTTVELTGSETSRAVSMKAAHQGRALWPLAVIALGGVLTVAWAALLGCYAFRLVADLAFWMAS